MPLRFVCHTSQAFRIAAPRPDRPSAYQPGRESAAKKKRLSARATQPHDKLLAARVTQNYL
ncbi:protein of unknown function [Hyphomicrobium sp. 1Nfss2.1]